MYPSQTILGWRKDGRPVRVIAGGDETATASPSPQAQSQATPPAGSVQDQEAALNAQVGSSGAGGSDLYGLGQWKNQVIDTTGWPPQIGKLLSDAVALYDQQHKAAPLDPTSMTAQQLVQVIAQSKSPLLVSNIQNMLLLSGAYPTSVKSMGDLQVGILGPQDIKALADTVTVAAQTGTPFGTYMTTSANIGKANGILTHISGATQNPVGQASRADTDPVLRSVAGTLFGHDPSPDEYARFQAFYNQKLLGEARSIAAAKQGNTTGLPDAYALGQAITDTPGGQFSTPPVAPPQTLTSQGESATAAEHDQLAAQRNVLGNGQYNPPVGQGYRNSTQYANPAYGAYTGQLAQDQQAMDQATNANVSNGTYTAAPNIQAAAEAFLRQDNPSAIGQQNVATRYRTLLSILTGSA